MSIGPLSPLTVSVAGAPLAQSASADSERVQQDASSQQLRIQNEVRAEDAAGVGSTDGENHETSDRDADGRRLWERPPGKAGSAPGARSSERAAKDITGEAGTLLDLSG